MSKARELKRLIIQRFYTSPQKHPFDMVEWETRTASITDPSGKTIFEQKDVEVPKTWSQLATNIVASKYFHGRLGTPQREHSVKQLISRVANTITDWGIKDNYFESPEDAEAFRAELTYILLTQRAAFNSPVWFNVGTEETENPQCSACQPYHALINTPQGLVQIGEIVEKNMVGLEVFDATGTTRVVATKYNGIKEVFRVTLNDGYFIEATGDHLVCAHNDQRTKELEWKRVDQLKVGEYMRIYTDQSRTATSIRSDPKLVSEAAIAGWLQAHKLVGSQINSFSAPLMVEFLVVNSDEEKWIRSHVEHLFPNAHCIVENVDSRIGEGLIVATRIRLEGVMLRPLVEKYGLLGSDLNIRVPNSIMTAPLDVVAAYLQSVFQSRGYVNNEGNSSRIGIVATSRKWMEDLLVLLSRFGIYARLRRKNGYRINGRDGWEIDIYMHSERKKFAERIGFISSEKNNKLADSLRIPGNECPPIQFQQITKIESLGKMPVYDIQTESGNYLTNSVLVHNCFINSVEDDMQSILDLVKIEGMIFKFGSGSGVNVSKLRAEGEPLSTGGTASGPLSFMKVFDAGAGAIKSGGKTRRAAKMVLMDVDHPDIMKFIWSKAHEEKKAWALIEAGYEGGINGEAYQSVFFQNANHSVRVPDEFMEKVLRDEEWHTTYRTTGERAATYKAREILRQIAQATWECGDPGMQFDTTINKWHTCKNSGRINASNPCSEFVFLDNTSCNLASINLMKYRNKDGSFNVEEFFHTIDIIFTAQEIIVSNAGYPTEQFKEMSEKFRPLGLGYTNLGALLMSLGLPYDSEEGRAFAAIITALMHGEAYKQSAVLARAKGPFEAFEENKEPMMEVMHMHKNALHEINASLLPRDLVQTALDLWEEVIELGEKYGYRNAQATLLAPTGTISFLLDCDTTGIEPDIALVKYKKLVGGGTLKMVNNTVPLALKTLGYKEDQITEIINYINDHDTIEGAPHLKPEHLPVFDCAFKPPNGTRFIHYLGHVKMMAAVQPFLSGAISKTVNVPETASTEDIMQTYIDAWKMGVKCIAIYRDGSKKIQPLSTKKDEKTKQSPVIATSSQKAWGEPVRKRLPDERMSITHKFSIEGHEGYITVGLYEDGSPGEVFITMSKEGSTISGLMDTIATLVSIALQYGIPLNVLVRKFINMRFEPSGFTTNPSIPTTKSIVDYVFRYLGLKFLPEDQREGIIDYEELRKKSDQAQPLIPANGSGAKEESEEKEPIEKNQAVDDSAPLCSVCGNITVRSGSCYVCMSCGSTTGCS